MRKLLLTLFAVFTANVAFGQTNLLTNGSFEEWTDGVPTGWMIAKSGENTAGSNVAVAQSTDAQAGTYAAALTNSTAGNSKPSNGRIASSEIKLKAGTYTYTIYVKAADETGAAARIGYVPIDATTGKVGSYAYGNNENGLSAPDTLTTTWLKKTQEFTLTETKTICLLVMHSKNYADKTVIIDNASLTTTDGGISDGTDDEPEVSIANTPETAYTATQALEIIAAGKDLNTKVYVKGKVTGTPDINTSYGNATYNITDGTSTLIIFRGQYLGNVKFESEDQLKEGDEVIVYGKLTLYQKEGQDDQPEMTQGNYIYSLNGTVKDEEEVDYSKVEAISIADFLQKADTKTMYKLTGVVRNLANATYGNFDLCDKDNEETKIYIYGVVKADDTSNNKIWASLGVNEGDLLTIVGTYTTYNESPQIAKAVYIKHEKGSDPVVDISNTPETAYTTSKAIELIDAGKGLSTQVYVKGTISKVGIEDKEGNLTDLPGNEYGNATYFITDGTVELEVYRGYYYNGDKFTAEDQIKVGDNVIIYGNLTKYKETYELGKGNYIYSLNGVTPVQGIAAQTEKAQVIYNLAGQRVEKAVKGIYIINGKKVLK